MAEIVGLNGKRVDAEIPRDDTPEAVLEKLLGEIKNGTAKVTRLTIIVEGDIGDRKNHYFTRTSLATCAEAMCLASIAHRLFIAEMLDV